MEHILVSACLLGVACRYDGATKPCQAVIDLINKGNIYKNINEEEDTSKDIALVPVCPEQLGGLATPRVPSERCRDRFNDEVRSNRVITANGIDVTIQYQKGQRKPFTLRNFIIVKRLY